MSATLPKIFVYHQPSSWGSDVIGYALAEDGGCLAVHLSSNGTWSKQDMIDSGWKDKDYKKHYPDGYELVWLDGNPSGEAFEKAFALNQERAAKEASDASTI
jgi:hypothetical protein